MLITDEPLNEVPNSGALTPSNIVTDDLIDPSLRHQASPFDTFVPKTTEKGDRVPEAVYAAHLYVHSFLLPCSAHILLLCICRETFTRRQPLRDACTHFQIHYAKKATLDWLRAALIRYW